MKRSDKFNCNNVESSRFILNINDLTMFDKASILYNHIYHSGLNDEYRSKFYDGELYIKIIKHKNFNPRLIEFITAQKRIHHIKSEDYINHIVNSLDNPSDIWHHAFTEQLKEIERIIIYFVAFSNVKLTSDNLSLLIKKYFISKKDTLNDESFNNAMTTITGSFILNEISKNSSNLRIFNPSIKDYLMKRLEDEVELSKLIFEMLNQPLIIEVTFPVSAFQRKISKRLVSSFKDYDLDRYYELFIRCSTNVINFGDGIDEELCLNLFRIISNEDRTVSLDYPRLVIINRCINKNSSYGDLNDTYELLKLRAFNIVSEGILSTLSSIIRYYRDVCSDLKHKAESYYEDLDNVNYILDNEKLDDYWDDNVPEDNKYEIQHEFFSVQYQSLLTIFEEKATKYWSDNYLNVADKLNSRRRINGSSSEVIDEVESILSSYDLISSDLIEILIDEFDFTDIEEKRHEEYLERSLNIKIKRTKSDDLIKIRALFHPT
ncbi:AAA ATPase [Moritella viscosa]|nr:AAA ATPase [Moritella viscosa]